MSSRSAPTRERRVLSRFAAPACAALFAALLSATCENLPRADPDFDPDTYEVCSDPEARGAWDNARALISEGKEADAIQPLRQVVGTCRQFVRGHFLYQDTALSLGGETEFAMREMYEGLEPVGPDDVVTFYVRARLLPDLFSRNEAVEQILARDGAFYWALLSRARIHRERGMNAQALRDYRATLALQPDLVDAHLETAEVMVEMGRNRQAAEHYDLYLRARPSDVAARRRYLDLLVDSLGDIKTAQLQVDELLALDPDDALVLMDRAAVAWRAGDLARAEADYRRVLELDETNARALLNLGNMYYSALPRNDAERLRDWPRAQTFYRDFLRLDRPEDGYDMFDAWLAVPQRLGEIERFLAGGELPAAVSAPGSG